MREVIDQIAATTGYEIDPPVVARRPGDPARLVADPTRISETLGWTSTKSLEDMVASAWEAWAPKPRHACGRSATALSRRCRSAEEVAGPVGREVLARTEPSAR